MIVPISAGNAIQMIVSSIVRDEPSQQGLLRATGQNQGLVEAQIPCGSGQRHDPDVSGEYKVTYEQKRVRWEAEGFVGSGSLVSTTPRFLKEFRKSLILNWSGRVDSNHRPPGPEPGALARLSHAPNNFSVNCRTQPSNCASNRIFKDRRVYPKR